MSIEWYNLTNGSFGDYKFHIAEPKGDKTYGVSSISWKLSRRLQRSRKPLVDGASIRDLGGNELDIGFEILFFGKKYLENYLEFEKAMTTGKPETLVIPIYPRGIQCYFANADVKSHVEEHNTLLVSVYFAQDEITDQSGVYATTKKLTREELASLIRQKASDLSDTVGVNPFVEAIRAAESGLSTVRRFSSRVLNIEESIRNRIAAVTQNLNDTLSLLDDAVRLIEKREDDVSSQFSSGFLGSEDDRSIVQFSDATESPVDAEDEIEESSASSEELNLSNSVAIATTLNSIKESIVSDSQTLTKDSEGNTDEVLLGGKELAGLIVEYAEYFSSPLLKTLVITRKTSLIEVMFKNGVEVNDLEAVHQNNMHIEDTVVLGPGEVVYL